MHERINATRAAIELRRMDTEIGDHQAALTFLLTMDPQSLALLHEEIGKLLTIWRIEAAPAFLAATRGEEQVHLLRTVDDQRALCGVQPPAGYTWTLWPYDEQGEDEVWDHHVWAGDVDADDVPGGGLICGICRDLYESMVSATPRRRRYG
jgi:hypothetical protein